MESSLLLPLQLCGVVLFGRGQGLLARVITFTSYCSLTPAGFIMMLQYVLFAWGTTLCSVLLWCIKFILRGLGTGCCTICTSVKRRFTIS